VKRICGRHGVYDGARCPSCPQGGRRTTQHEIRSSKRWQRVAKFVRRRDGNRCTYGTYKGEHVDGGRCTKTGPSLPVHHVQPVEEAPELAFEPGNCRTLCTTHHNRIDAERRRNGTKRDDRGQAAPGPDWRRRDRVEARVDPATASAGAAAAARAAAGTGNAAGRVGGTS
jgi:5-methylcytosine-specific restriction endonuclease McrA